MIKNVLIENFKSLQKFQIPLERLNVFIGPNGTGKSNIINSLEFFKELLSVNPWYEPLHRNGFSRFMYGFDDYGQIRFKIEFEVNVNKKVQSLTYDLAIEKTGSGDYNIAIEYLHAENNQYIHVHNSKGKYCSFSKGRQQIPIDLKLNILNNLRFNPNEMFYHPIFDYFNSWFFCHPIPSLMKKSFKEANSTFKLDKEGEEFDLVLDSIARIHADNFQAIKNILQTMFPEFQDMVFRIVDKRVQLEWKDKYFKKAMLKNSLSDGILKILYLLALVYNPEPPPVIAIEEPENYIHPGFLQQFADLLIKASQKMQIIVTSHSPVLVEFLPEKYLFLIDKKEGRTVWQRFSAQKKNRVNLKKNC